MPNLSIPDWLDAGLRHEIAGAITEILSHRSAAGVAPAVVTTVIARTAHHAYMLGRDAALGELLTTEQVAGALGVTPGRVRQLARAHNVGWLVGRDRIYQPADVARLRDRTGPGWVKGRRRG